MRMYDPNHHDPNFLMRRARELAEQNAHYDALCIYLHMADGDCSLDGGWLGERIGECYQSLGDPYSAKYWFARAVEENPEVRLGAAEALKKLADVRIDDLLKSDGT